MGVAMRRHLRPIALGLTLVVIAGCSISDSSVSISDSIGSSSDSSASSSRSRSAAYQDDVRDFAAAWDKSGGQYDEFQSQVARLASKHGISDWENNKATWVGVGAGLRRGGVAGTPFETYKQNLTGGDADRMSWLQQGYARGK
jgi:hypothetical protein